MCRLRNIVLRDYQESVTTGWKDRPTHGQTEAGQSDHYVQLCFAGDKKIRCLQLHTMNDFRCTMSRWTADRSILLSLLLDDVTGSQEATHIRHDFCMLFDAVLKSQNQRRAYHFTGSKAEGLELPGSDYDMMVDINDIFRIKVIQSDNEESDTSFSKFLLCTESDNPCFALLQSIDQPSEIQHPIFKDTIQTIKGVQYLSSNLLMNFFFKVINLPGFNFTNMTSIRTGPSIEQWAEFADKSESGTDSVMSIHCEFWPNDALEWVQRPRHYGWPLPQDISSIVDFGCHLVAIGHPHSNTKLEEWRISFSVAERTLVWSFNHIQMQCYAVMKIILKEFIKKRCSPPNRVLCSYFIKTFLFWKYETTDLDFWCESNFRECLLYLLIEFSKCIKEGKLMHYFIPNFNLLSVKLTPAAKIEILKSFDIIFKRDISILKECITFQNIWSNFLSHENQINIIYNQRRKNFLKDDKLMMEKLKFLIPTDMYNDRLDLFCSQFLQVLKRIFPWLPKQEVDHYASVMQVLTVDRLLKQIIPLSCKTDLKSLVVKKIQVEKQIKSLVNPRYLGNRDLYKVLHSSIAKGNASYDISSGKLWCATMLLKRGNYNASLSILNQFISNIPPFAFYEYTTDSYGTTCLYADKFLDSACSTTQRAGQAWLTDIIFPKHMTEILPLGIKIEQYFTNYINHQHVSLSPYIYVHYLMFLCYHGLHQFDRRDCTLQRVTDIVKNKDQCGLFKNRTLNIVGHCLLICGKIEQARNMFNISLVVSTSKPVVDIMNSARWYLTNFCSET